jgi:hypothetical protein
MAEQTEAERRKALREARSAAALRANLARRKTQLRGQTIAERSEDDDPAPGSAAQSPDADLARRGPRR